MEASQNVRLGKKKPPLEGLTVGYDSLLNHQVNLKLVVRQVLRGLDRKSVV